jgi:hypothetical protein
VASLESSEGGGKVVFSGIEEMTVTAGLDDEWPNANGEATLKVSKNELPLDVSRRYNFRVKNNAKTEKTFTIRAVLIPKSSATTLPTTEMISGLDALAMFICVVGVFIVSSIMATLTMRIFPRSEGTLVVEEEDEIALN